MSQSLQMARRLRIDLAAEIDEVERGSRRISQVTAYGASDVTPQHLTNLRERHAQLELLIASFEQNRSYAVRSCL